MRAQNMWCCVCVAAVLCSSYVYLLNVTIAGIFNKGYLGTNQALKVSQSGFCHEHYLFGHDSEITRTCASTTSP